jgi:perosamine synthetase
MKYIPVFSPKIYLKDIFFVARTLFDGEISGTSNTVQKFELNMAKEVGRSEAIAVANGSVALDLALQSLGLTSEDEVILPAFTIISGLAAVVRTGAKPVFADVDISSWNTSVEEIKSKISKKTKAILIVHTYGLPVDAVEIEKLCNEKGIYLVEDAAEAHGLEIRGRKCGSFGNVSTFSFYANKHISTGEGGMILTNEKAISNKVSSMRNLDFNTKNRFVHDNFYWNYRMGGLQAALGISQIRTLKKRIKEKQRQGKIYQELLKDHTKILQTPLESWHEEENNYWVFGIVVKVPGIRDAVMNELKTLGIETRPFFWPLNLQPAYISLGSPDNADLTPNSRYLGENGLYLPMGKHVSKKDQTRIVLKITELIESLKSSK